ncbi:hypothetical protein N8Z24_00115 [bacterium]|nr:hypothetical protein [bacterium]
MTFVERYCKIVEHERLEMKKTELEKSWEDEDEDAKELEVEDLSEDSESGENGNLIGSSDDYVMNPLDSRIPLVVAFCGPRAIVGGLMSVSEGSTELSITDPVLYAEEASKTPEGALHRRPVLARIMNFVSLPEVLVIHPEFFHFLKNDSGKNLDLAAAYERTVQAAMADDAGIQQPSVADIRSINGPLNK